MAKEAHLSIRMSAEEKAALEELASRLDLTMGQLVRRALRGLTGEKAPSSAVVRREASVLASRESEIEWLRNHGRKLQKEIPGQWVIVEGDKLIAHGTDYLAILAEARRQGVKVPFVERIPEPGSGVWMGL